MGRPGPGHGPGRPGPVWGMGQAYLNMFGAKSKMFDAKSQMPKNLRKSPKKIRVLMPSPVSSTNQKMPTIRAAEDSDVHREV